MSRVRTLLVGFVAALAGGAALAAGASAVNPCTPVKGVSRCVFGIQTSASGEPEPLRVGQAIQQEWWGRGSYFNAGRYSYLCHTVAFTGSVSKFAGGAPVFATPTTSFAGSGPGGSCTSSIGAVDVSASSQSWTIGLSVKEAATPGQYLVSELLKTANKTPLVITADYQEEGFGPIVCNWSAQSAKGTWTWAANEQIAGMTAAARFKLDTEASNSPLCPASGKLETNWRFLAAPPAGGLVPMVLAIH